MITVTLVSLLHTLGPRFPVYAPSLLLPCSMSIRGISGCHPSRGAVVAALRQHAKGVRPRVLAPLAAGWCDFGTGGEGETPELDALASYDEEMLDNLQMYWHSPGKIKQPDHR